MPIFLLFTSLLNKECWLHSVRSSSSCHYLAYNYCMSKSSQTIQETIENYLDVVSLSRSGNTARTYRNAMTMFSEGLEILLPLRSGLAPAFLWSVPRRFHWLFDPEIFWQALQKWMPLWWNQMGNPSAEYSPALVQAVFPDDKVAILSGMLLI